MWTSVSPCPVPSVITHTQGPPQNSTRAFNSVPGMLSKLWCRSPFDLIRTVPFRNPSDRLAKSLTGSSGSLSKIDPQF